MPPLEKTCSRIRGFVLSEFEPELPVFTACCLSVAVLESVPLGKRVGERDVRVSRTAATAGLMSRRCLT